MNNIIYLDNNSTTPIDPRVLDEMMPFLKDQFANASSNHILGVQVKKEIDIAKLKVADLINANPKRVVFTSGATEAINLALKSFISSSEPKKHIITLQTEHKAILDTCKYLESVGFEITYLAVQKDGILELDLLKQTIRADTLLISVMWVNNETGVIQNIEAISEICEKADVLFMTDATQAVGKISINVSELKIDILTLSGHKFYAPKGIGALYYSQKASHYISPQIHGGGHENGLRSGTLNTAAIVGIGRASEIALEELNENSNKIKSLRDKLEKELLKLEGATINGNAERRIYNVSNIYFPNLDSDVLIGKLKTVAVSNGSACTTSLIEPSHVLKAMDLESNKANGSIRLSLGKFNTFEDIDKSISELTIQIKSLQLIH
ncbi:MAG: iscS 2 [Bacteroidota bacterium]|jgi:cysteine desulfurase|nr:iscS 2 [Bacteroidota bacterium]